MDFIQRCFSAIMEIRFLQVLKNTVVYCNHFVINLRSSQMYDAFVFMMKGKEKTDVNQSAYYFNFTFIDKLFIYF